MDTVDTDLVLALGFFDGIHVGHQKLLNKTVKIARKMGISPGLFTFSHHPLEVIHHGLCFPYLSSMHEKHCVARNLGIEHFITAEFTEDFSHLFPQQFVTEVLQKQLRGRAFVVGKDYRFGFHASGNLKSLREMTKEFDRVVYSVADVMVNGLRVSSTGIREAIMGGNLDYACTCLGRWYNLAGKVKPGKKRGRGLGFPTANLDLPPDRVMPRPGVYAVFVLYDDQVYPGAAHVGERPTFRENTYNLETHLLNFEGDLYEKEITVFLVKHLRDTNYFENPTKMSAQLSKDVKTCRDLLTHLSRKEILENIPCARNYEIILK